MDMDKLKLTAAAVVFMVVGAMGADLILSPASAATAGDTYDTGNAEVSVVMSSLPDGGILVHGCASTNGAIGQARACTPSFELTRASTRAAGNAVLDVVARRAFASMGFAVDGGQ